MILIDSDDFRKMEIELIDNECEEYKAWMCGVPFSGATDIFVGTMEG